MNNKNLKKKRLKLNPDAFIGAAEIIDRWKGKYWTEFSCIILQNLEESVSISINDEVDFYSDIFEIMSAHDTFNCKYKRLTGLGYEMKLNNAQQNELDNIRILCLCLAAELAHQYNNKKGGSFQ